MILIISLLIVSIFVLSIAMKIILQNNKLRKEGIKSSGVIISKEVDTLTHNTNNVSYPQIKFLTADNEWIIATSKIGTLPFLYKIGQKVSVIYQKENPNNFIVNERFIYSIPIAMIIISSIIFFVGLAKLLIHE